MVLPHRRRLDRPAHLVQLAHLTDKDQLGTVIAVSYRDGATVDQAAANSAAGTVSTSRTGSFQALGSYKSENGSLMLMQAFLYGISALVIVAFLTVWTVQRTRDIAVLKAMGASGGYLLRDAITQAAIVLLAGAGIGGRWASRAASSPRKRPRSSSARPPRCCPSWASWPWAWPVRRWPSAA